MNRNMISHIPVSATLFILGALTLFGCSPGLLHTGQTNLNDTIAYALPKGYIKVTCSSNQITIDTNYEPDPNQYYVLEYTPNIGFDDDITLTTDNKGFLKSINSTTKSKFPEIVQAITKIPLAAMRIPTKVTGVPNFELIMDPKDIKQYNPQTFSDTMSLLEKTKKIPQGENVEAQKAAIEAAKRRLSEMGGTLYQNYRIAYISLEHPKASFLYTDSAQSATQRPPADNRGICYRPGLPFKLRILIGDNYYERMVYLPNYSKLITFDVSRPAFVQKVQALTFDNGMLTSVNIKKDSELLAVLGIPADLVKTVAGLPLELISVKTSDINAQAGLLNAQTALIQAQQALQQAQTPTTTK
jgi:hypothetical protein